MIQKIQLLTSPEEVNLVYEFVKKFPLDYPDYFLWLEKCRRELELGYKKAFFATDSCEIMGSVIFQPHKQDCSVLEIKNLRVCSEFEKKGLGSLLLQLVELFAEENSFKRIQSDIHPENPAISLALKRGYDIKAEENLYTAKKEIILCKDLI